VRPEIRFHIRPGGGTSPLGIGPGKVALLEAIRETGSITSAAKSLGMSYRRAWMLIDETNRCLVQPAVDATAGGQHGGGTALTPIGVELVARYRALERETAGSVERELATFLRKTSPGRKAR
jgi:molybdate transport system regulatory protein